jgi:hypothetical protein
MGDHKCKQCKKSFTHKGDYDRHIKRKTPCKTAKDPLYTVKIPSKSIHVETDHSFNCKFCLKTFTRQDSLSLHIKERCKVKKEKDNEKEAIFIRLLEEKLSEQQVQHSKKLEEHLAKQQEQNKKILEEYKKEIEDLKQQISLQPSSQNIDKQQNIDRQQNINAKNVNIINNNATKVIAFGKEDLSFITDDLCAKILKRGFKSVPQLIEHVHFNEEKPEYHNVYIPNIRNEFAMTHDGSDWNLQARTDVITQLNDGGYDYIDSKYHELKKKGSLDEATIKKVARLLDERDTEPSQSKIKRDLELILYNKRKMVMKKKPVKGLLY